MSGIGTIDNPWDLQTALNSQSVVPGDKLRLRNGTYFKVGGFTSTINGASAKPIIIEPYPGESPVIDEKLQIFGDYTTWRNGIEFRYSGWQTRLLDPVPPIGTAYGGIYNERAAGTRIINLIIHDVSYGIFGKIYGGLVYGNILYNIGYADVTDRVIQRRGHTTYNQNPSSDPLLYKHNILYGGWYAGFHNFAIEAGELQNISFIENISFENAVQDGVGDPVDYYDAILVGGTPSTRIVVNGNLTYYKPRTDHPYPTINIGYFGASTSPTVQDNVVCGYPDGDALVVSADDLSKVLNNAIYIFGSYPVSGLQVFVHPNIEQAGWANVTIYNWGLADSVAVNVSGVLSPGDNYQLHNAQDYFGDIQTGAVAQDGTIDIDMQAINRSVAAPIGWTAIATVCPQFGAFRLVRQ